MTSETQPRYFHIIGDTPVKLWGLTPRERLERQSRQVGGLSLVPDLEGLSPDASVLLAHGGYITEARTFKGLLNQPGTLLRCATDQRLAAAFVPATSAEVAAALLRGDRADIPEGLRILDPADLDAFDKGLRRSAPPLLEPVSKQDRDRLEDLLYGNAYKGITDLVTKWLWPRPAKQAVHWFADRGVTPNMITSAGFLLMLLAGLLFYQGHYAWGLAAGWIMTFLDTVDGKLARVTIQSSRAGHLLDHGMDLIHPPFWYLLWGMSLTGFDTLLGMDRGSYYGMIFIGYVGGRLCEALFHLLGGCSIFGWRPFDAYFRLITARRNPSLILLTLAVIIGRPDWGFAAVALWTALSTGVLVLRLAQGLVFRTTQGPLHSWLSSPEQAAREHPNAFRRFSVTRRAYLQR